MLDWALENFLGETDRASAVPAFMMAIAFSFAWAFGAGVFAAIAVGRVLRLGRTVDLDASEIIIPRAKWRRVPFTLAYLVAGAIFGILLVGAIDQGNAAGSVFWLVFVLSMILNIWRTWRKSEQTYAPVVLDREGIQDRSTDKPRIPWQDIAEIDNRWGNMTLTRESALRLSPPDAYLLKRWLTRPRPKIMIDTGGLEPDQPYAKALIRAYWLRRRADGLMVPSPQEQRAVSRSSR